MIPRRALLLGTSSALVAAGLVGCSESPKGPVGGGVLRFSWWGNAGRAERTEKAIATHAATTDSLEIQTEFLDWTGYWDKLSTQVAGGTPPDLLQMSEAYQGQYMANESLLDLRTFINDGTIDTSSYADGVLPSEGAITAIPWAVNMRCALSTVSALEKAGIDPDTDLGSIAWDAYGDFLSNATDAAGIPGSVDPGFWIENLETWLMQQGKSLYGDSTAGFTEDDLLLFWEMTQSFAEAGIVTDASTSSRQAGGGTELAALVTSEATIDYRWSTEAVIFDGLGVADLRIMTPPGELDTPGRFQHAAMLLSVSAASKNQEAAAKLLSHLVSSPEAAVELGMERGAPVSSTFAEAITDQLSDIEKAMLAYHDAAAGKLLAPPRVVPPGGGEMLATYTRVYESVAFGREPREKAAADFVAQMSKVAGA